jgi:RNA polymerase sigma factor (sigma-70 family)
MSPEELFKQYAHLAPATVIKYYKGNHKGISKKYSIDIEDLFQYAYEALYESALKYDESKGNCKFQSFAITKIKWALQTRIHRDCKTMSFQGLGRTGLDYEYIKKNLKFVSLDDFSKSGNSFNDQTNHELVGDDYNLEGEAIGNQLTKYIEKRYDPRTVSIIKSRMEGMNNSEIGDEIGLSRERVRQILSKVKKELQGVM